MPIFQISTNILKSKIPADFLKTTSSLVAKILGKPENLVMLEVTPNQQMCFGGSTDPCAYCVLKSIGNLGITENKAYSKALGEHIEKNLGIPMNRSYITFYDTPPSNAGFDGTTRYDFYVKGASKTTA